MHRECPGSVIGDDDGLVHRAGSQGERARQACRKGRSSKCPRHAINGSAPPPDRQVCHAREKTGTRASCPSDCKKRSIPPDATITVLPLGRALAVERGTLLRDALQSARIMLDYPAAAREAAANAG